MNSKKPRVLKIIPLVLVLFTIHSIDIGSAKFSKIPKIKTLSYSRSAVGLRKLIYADLQIAKVIIEKLHMVHCSYDLRKTSQKYLQDLMNGNSPRNWNSFSKDQARSLAKNPIAAYTTIRRMVKILPDLIKNANGSLEIFGDEVARSLRRGLPEQADLEDAMKGILRLHTTYGLTISQFAKGNISGVQTGAKLNALHCFEIGMFVRETLGNFAQAIDWLELTLQKIKVDGDTMTADEKLAEREFLDTLTKHDESFDQATYGDARYFSGTIESMALSGNYSERKTDQNVVYEKYRERQNRGNLEFDYRSVCNGGNLQTVEEKSKLFCWLEFKQHPRFQIGPLKMEFLARSPDVVQIYEVLSDQLIDRIKTKTTSRMNRSDVTDHEDEPDIRVSEDAEINDEDEEFLPFSQLLNDITGLQTVSRGFYEKTAILFYASTGYYFPHVDTGIPEEYQDAGGKRIATFMTYLSDVELGGFTAFPHLGFAIKPMKGSAVFWYNLFRDGTIDFSVWHGGCPVILGDKYVVKKRIRYNDQFSTHKCSTNLEDRFRVAVNQVQI